MKKIIPMIMIGFFCSAQEAQDVTPAGAQQAVVSGGVGTEGDPAFDALFTIEEMSLLDTTQHPMPSDLLDARKNASRELINQGFLKGMFSTLSAGCTMAAATTAEGKKNHEATRK